MTQIFSAHIFSDSFSNIRLNRIYNSSTDYRIINKTINQELNLVTAGIPKNLSHLLSPLDLTVNRSIKQVERGEFSLYILHGF